MSSGMNNKVDSSTQVEYSFVEARRIVGQEDSTVKHLSNSLSSLSLRKQGKGIRPPLVGQASSSSNDSVSLPFDSRSSGILQERTVTSPIQSSADLHQLSDSLEHKRTLYLPNRNDYINQKPPEGSYVSNVHSSIPPNEANHDLTRVRSSSSASSVTSSRPLEWDNGADVGYDQCNVMGEKIPDSNMSTVERMALVRSTKLLRRADPEGTTGGTIQLVLNPIPPKMRVKKFGHPNAESTPLGTCLVSDGSPDTIDFISPIPYEKRQDSEPEVYTSESDACEQTLLRLLKDEYAENQRATSGKPKVPLFPEISLGAAMPSNINEERNEEALDIHDYDQRSGRVNSRLIECNDPIDNNTNAYISSENHQFSNLLKAKLETVESFDIAKKKLSSSLENVSNIDNNAPSDGKTVPCTLPRSQSQTDLCSDKTSCVYINNKGSRSNNLIQNLFKNKSASSSSVATVVHRKGDSPKHAVVQTSLFAKQSVGTQVCCSLDENPISIQLKTVVTNPFCETPHLPKAVLTQPSKSNYFDIVSNNKYTNFPLDQHLQLADDNFVRTKIMSNSETHCHSGILCKGAHKKSLVSKEPIECRNQQGINFINSPNSGRRMYSSVSVPGKSQDKVCPENLCQRKNTSVGLIDSVESSAKSGGCDTEKLYSVTVEDRVNSFEYLPGHVYENNERHHPINSCGTSSMSIENHTSNNATPEDQNNIWESSGGSVSTSFDKDAQRGVDILTGFVKDTYENDTLLKRKLINRVIDKLISINKIHKTIRNHDLMKNTPWVPPRPSNPVERNTIKNSKSKVPCEISSHSEKSGNTNTSSECFIPKPLDRNKCCSSFYKENPFKTNDSEFSSTSNFTPDKVANLLEKSSKPLKSTDNKTKDSRKTFLSKPPTSSNKAFRTDNWKEPATKTEKLIEERRKIQNDSSGSHTSVSQLLDMERENQLFWIRSEIDHLSNLKLLLERQEELKRSLKNCKLRRDRPLERNVLKDKNRQETHKTSVETSSHPDAINKKSSLKSRSGQPLKLNKWLKDFNTESKNQEDELEGWVSHQYENDENIKSCMKRKTKNKIWPSKTKTVTDKDYVMYDDPPASSQRRKYELEPKSQSTASDCNPSESTSMGEKDRNRRNAYDRVTHANKPRQQVSEPKHGCKCLCQCCAKPSDGGVKKKEPLGYYIIFDNPKKRNKSLTDRNQFQEKGVSWPKEEQKLKSARQNSLEQKITGPDNVEDNSEAGLNKRTNIGGCTSSETEPTSNESANDWGKNDHNSTNPIFKGAAGELQYHLLHNRPSYVSRAEDRRQCIAQMQYLRELSRQNKRRLLSLSQPVADPPAPQPIKIRRVFSQHKMRQMTEKKYRQLSEVKEKLQDTKKKESYRTNRLMAEIFNKNLQKRVLKGEVNLSNSVFVISSL